MKNNKILVLKRCIKNNESLYNFKYPNAGEIVEVDKWNTNKLCGGGLHGWTKENWQYSDFKLKGNWVVIEVDKKDGFIELHDKVKFRKGLVIYNGKSFNKAKNIMLKQQPGMIFHFDNITTGDHSTLTAGDHSTLTAGYSSTLTAGDHSTLTAGDHSTLTAGYSSALTAGDKSTLTSGNASTLTSGNGSTLAAGYCSTLAAGNGSTLTTGYSSTLAAGYCSTLTAGDYSTLTAWIESTLTAGNGSTLTAGNGSTLTSGYSSTLTSGYCSTLTAGSYSTLTAGDYSTLTASSYSTLTAGDHSFINNYIDEKYHNIVKPGRKCVISSINTKKNIANSFISNKDNVVYVINSDCNIENEYTTTPDNINKLKEYEIIVFGSNLNGNHAGGLARVCTNKFDAEYGIGEGATGQCYAFPTLDKSMNKVTNEDIRESVDKLIEFANKNPWRIILLTKVGCGIAGFKEDYIKEFFKDLPANIIKPKGW